MKLSFRTLAAPTIALALMIGMIATDATGVGHAHPGAAAYFDRVAETIGDVPLQTGPWVGLDIPVIPAAQDLLQPNKVLQRRYTNTETGESFEVLIVHCKDVRDMLGHFPPVCYPANGWKLEQKVGTTAPLGDGDVPATRYGFSREVDFVRDEIRIVNLFVLPASEGDSYGPDFGIVERAGRYRQRARLGAGQVQVIVPATVSADRRAEIVETAMDLIEPVLRDVERGPQ
jgi:hypothetical protein